MKVPKPEHKKKKSDFRLKSERGISENEYKHVYYWTSSA